MQSSWQGTGVPCQVKSKGPCWSTSVEVLEAGVGRFSDALLGLRRCRLSWALTETPKYVSKEGEEEKGRKDPK